MKSKKLFAILTLVAFMMTLLPMAAFAGIATYSASASYITVDKESVATSDSTVDRPIKVTFVARKSDGSAVTTGDYVYVYAKTDNDAVQLGVLKDDWYNDAADNVDAAGKVLSTGKVVYKGETLTGADGALFVLKADANGRATLYAWSVIGGTTNLKFYDKGPDTAKDELLIDSKTLTFEASAASIHGVKFNTTQSNTTAGTELTIKAQVYDNSFNGIEGKDVTFYVKKGSSASYTSIGVIKTDDLGVAELKYTPTEAATSYDIKAKCGDKSKVHGTFDVAAASPIKIEAKDATKYVDTDKATDIKFYMYDAYGNKNYDKSKVTIECSKDPTDSGIEGTDLTEQQDATDKLVYVSLNPDVDGEYTIKASINGTGIKAESKVVSGGFGTIKNVSVKLADDDDKGIKTKNLDTTANTRSATANTNSLRIKLVDENGLEKDATADDTILTSSNTDLLAFLDSSAFGKVYGPIDNSKGKATVTAIHKDTGLSASLEINVLGGPSAIQETIALNDKTADVTIQMVDSQGEKAFYGVDKEYDVFAPSGVTVETKKVIDDVKGYGTFVLQSDSYGEKTITVAIADGLAKTFTVTFKEPAAVIEGAAKKVNMFIGNTGYVKDGAPAVTDVAPFIQNGRTFVAVRPLADAFGAEIGWDEATKTVTLTRADKTVTIVIGSSTITVVSNGVTSTVTADEPAFVKEGRTVLPFRAVGEAFGYAVSYDAATQAVSYSL